MNLIIIFIILYNSFRLIISNSLNSCHMLFYWFIFFFTKVEEDYFITYLEKVKFG